LERYFIANTVLTEYPNDDGLSLKISDLIKAHKKEIKKKIGYYLTKLLRKYCKHEFYIDFRFPENSFPDSEENYTNNFILNSVNWIVSLSNCKSALTNIFFKEGSIPNDFSEYFSSNFIIGGLEIERINEKIILKNKLNYGQSEKINEKNQMNISSDNEKIKKISDNLLRLFLFSCFYVFTKLKWIPMKEICNIFNLEKPDEIYNYFKNNLNKNVKIIKKS